MGEAAAKPGSGDARDARIAELEETVRAPAPRTTPGPPSVPAPLPDLGPQMQVIARAVVAAAEAREAPEDPREVTARFERAEICPEPSGPPFLRWLRARLRRPSG